MLTYCSLINPCFSLDGDCYEDSRSRLLGELRKDDRQSMTPEMCQRICFVDNDFTYSGVQYFHECFCGNVEPPTTKLRTRSECDAPCAGNSDKMCGGSWRMNVYKNQVRLSGRIIIFSLKNNYKMLY